MIRSVTCVCVCVALKYMAQALTLSPDVYASLQWVRKENKADLRTENERCNESSGLLINVGEEVD